MATHAAHHHHHHDHAHGIPALGSAVVRVGATAGLVAGMAMAMWQMVVGAIAQEPTAVAGIDSSFWTAVTSIPSVVLGTDWFHGSFDFGAVVLGLMGHMMNAMMIGIAGILLITRLLGSRPSTVHAVALGMTFGLAVQLLMVNLVVNQIQTVQTLSTSTPEWSWWIAHAMFGGILGLVGAALLRRS